MDPRIYLILPEHVSNAYSIWNCAWFFAQMSNLAETSQSSKQFGLLNGDEQNHVIKTHSNSTNLVSNGSNGLSLLLENILMNNVNDSIINDLKSNDYFKFNEPIMTILKIKKRNKASLFNLILPSTSTSTSSSSSSSSSSPVTLSSSSCSSSCSSLTSSSMSSIPVNNNRTENIKILEIDKSTTPWLLKQFHTNSHNSNFNETQTTTPTNTSNNNNNNSDSNNNKKSNNNNDKDETDLTNSNDLNETINFNESSHVNSSSESCSNNETTDQCTTNDEQDLVTEYDYNEGCKR